MSDINYKVRYVNQYDQIVREVPKTGTLGDTVSITPNQLGYGFETIVADPKSLELVEDESLNIVEFRVMQTLNNLTVGNHYLDKRLAKAERVILDHYLDTKTLWTGSVTAGNIQISGLKPDFSNCKALVFEAGLDKYFFDDSLLWSSYPLQINVNTLVLSSPQRFFTKLANTKIFGSSQHILNYSSPPYTTVSTAPHELTKLGHIEVMVNNNNNLTIASTPMTFLYGKRGAKDTPEYYDVPLYVKKISYIPK